MSDKAGILGILTSGVSQSSASLRALSKRTILGALNRFEHSEDRILKQLAHFDVVSFDIFDTLVKRDCASPSEIFVRVAKRFNAEHSDKKFIDPVEFKETRCAAAATAKQYCTVDGRSEISLEEIYACFPREYDGIAQELKQLELECELDAAYPNAPMKRAYNACVNEGKRVVVISDMYLPCFHIQAILKKCGYTGYEAIFISSDWQAKKSDGALFDVALSQLGVKASQCVHLGDDLRSDFLNARRAGMRSVHIARNPKRTIFSGRGNLNRGQKIAYEDMRLKMDNYIDPLWSDYVKYGFECMGPLLVGFSQWLVEESKRNGVETIHFMARDGYLLKMVFDAMGKPKRAESKYLYISRRSVHIPLIQRYRHAGDYLALNGPGKRWSLITACNRLGVNPASKVGEWERLGFNEDSSFRVSEINSNEQLRAFLDEMLDSSKQLSKEAEAAAIAYFKTTGIGNKAMLVDSGGNGTTQRCLEMLLVEKRLVSEIKGNYLWLSRAADESFREYLGNEKGVVGGETTVNELFMTSEEGTVREYDFTEDQVSVPVLEDFEFAAYSDMISAIRDVQWGAVEFAKRLSGALDWRMEPEIAYHNAKMATRYPRLKEVKLFGELFFHSDEEDTYLANPSSLLFYVAHPNQLISEFKLVRWKVGFLKALFKAPFPYYELLLTLKHTALRHV